MMDCFCSAPRSLACRVVLLDERELMHEIQDNSTGQALLDVVYRHLDLLETAYFGLRYVDQDNQTHWLDAGKRLKRQLRGNDPHTFYFGVKFYASDPCKLLEEITRYQLFLQVKQDVLRGRLPVTFDLAAELAAYVLQSELGDYEPRRHAPGYVSEFRLVASQSAELETRAAEIHRTLTGLSPAQAELSYLDKVKWLDMYGVDLHPVLGEDSVEYFLGLAPSGLLLLRGKHAVANYYWPRVSKLYYKGRYFMLRVADKNNETSTYGFESVSRAACRHLWRCCSDHHAFFRLQQVSPAAADIFALGARFSSGRNIRPRPPPAFTRTPSRRHARSHLTLAHASLHDDTKLDNKKSPDFPEVKQPLSVQRPTSVISESGILEASSCRGGGGGSPRSTRSAPARRGLYTATPPTRRPPPAPRGRSASVDSQSSNDSRSTRKHRHRSRRQSDAESELSRGSGRSGRRHRHRSRHKRDSGSEREDHSHQGHRTKEYELIDSELQWREVQRQTASAGSGVQVASVRRSQMEPETGTHRSSHRHRRHRKHRSRSGSPNEKKWLPTELKQHLEYQLVDTSGMSEEQLKEIPYTVVQTSQARQTKLRQSRHKLEKSTSNHHPLLPPIHKSSSSINNHSHGSIRSGSSTISSQRNVNDKHSSARKGYSNYNDAATSVRGDDYLSSNNIYKSGVMSNPTTTNNNSNSNSSSGELIASSARVSHEHTDSGLGADQDYAYSSERSSDSAKYPAPGSGRASAAAAAAPACAPVSSRLHSVSVCGDLSALSLARKPPAPPVHRPRPPCGSLRSLVSVASEGRATSRRGPSRAPPLHHDSAFPFHRHGSNNNILESGHGRRGDPSWRTTQDYNANVTRRHSRHDNTLNIILKPLIESTQMQGN